jgi:hypothetical protein
MRTKQKVDMTMTVLRRRFPCLGVLEDGSFPCLQLCHRHRLLNADGGAFMPTAYLLCSSGTVVLKPPACTIWESARRNWAKERPSAVPEDGVDVGNTVHLRWPSRSLFCASRIVTRLKIALRLLTVEESRLQLEFLTATRCVVFDR